MGGITVEDLYNYSVKVAAVAQRIGRIHSDDAYTAALLHQIGRLILMTKLPEEYQDAIDLQQKNGARFETHNVRQLALTKMKQVRISYRFGDCPKG